MKYPIQSAKYEFEIEKSKFISQLFFIKKADEAKPIVQSLWKQHPQATHIVWAFVVGLNGEISGRSDDGEPSGTAGNPTLDPIVGNQITGCLITTIRYFGGIKLGTGGLVRAYSEGAREVIALAQFQSLQNYSKGTITIPYPLYDSFQSALSDPQIIKLNESFGEAIDITLQFPSEYEAKLQKWIQDLSRGTLQFEITSVPSPFDD